MALATAPITTWWLVGDLSESAYARDHMFEAPKLTPGQELAIGVIATVLSVIPAAVVAAALAQRRLRWVQVRPALPILVAGVFCGFSWRVTTARVSGANIGGGMLMLITPIVLILSIAWSWHLRRRAPSL